MTHDIWIAVGKLTAIERSDSDATILPDYSPGEGATLISEKDWIALVDASGRIDEETGGELPPSEALVMKDFGVTEDLRGEDGWRYQPESKESIEVTEAIGAE